MSIPHNPLAGVPILVTGALGMLAHDLVPKLHALGARLTLSDLREGKICGLPVLGLDITSASAVAEAVANTKPQWILNCAAFTAVDDAEKQVELAHRLNSEAVGILAQSARTAGARMLHISTDYVFGADVGYGERRTPWTETMACNPCGVYGKSKRAGEAALLEILPDSSLLVRTSWLHGVYGPNFITTMIRVAQERDELRVVNDQVGSPTWSGWLAGILCELLAKDERGVFHAASRGDITWLDFAKEIFAAARMSHLRVLSQTTAELNRPAPRPAYSTLSVDKLERVLGREVPDFRYGMKKQLELLGVC